MDMKLKPFDFASAVARAGLGADGLPVGGVGGAAGVGGARKAAATAGAASFQSVMSSALKGVSQSQSEADRLQRELQLGNPTVSLEQTMISMQKAQIGFQAVLQTRNRLVQAYSEIMNMNV